MDFDKSSFAVDWYTPGDKYPKRLSFPKSARISIDDLVPESPLSICFTPVDGAVLRPRSYSFVDTPLEAARGWTNSAPTSPADREQYAMYPQEDLKEAEDALDWETSPGLQSIADDCALCGVDLDISCLDSLDEQLLRAPVECFTELCWASAVRDEPAPPRPRSRARSFKCDYDTFAPPSPLAKEYPGSFERTRPLAARITLPLDRLPHYISTSSDYDLPKEMKKMLHAQDDRLGLPVQGVPVPRKRREQALTRSLEPHSQPSTPRHGSRSNHTLRMFSDAYSTFTRSRRKSRH